MDIEELEKSIVFKLDALSDINQVLVGYNDTDAISVHRVKVGDVTSEPIYSKVYPKFEFINSLEELIQKDINVADMIFMSSRSLLSMYPGGIKQAVKNYNSYQRRKRK